VAPTYVRLGYRRVERRGYEWQEWAPRTRDSELEALSRFIPLAVRSEAKPSPEAIRDYLKQWLRPGYEPTRADTAFDLWLGRSVLSLGELDESALAEVERALGLGLKGQTWAPNTANGFRWTAKACIQRAADLKRIPKSPWPPTQKGRSRRKSQRNSKAIDITRLPNPQTMLKIIDAVPSHQPSSHKYEVMTAIGYLAGLRRSEVIMLSVGALELPESGWGRIDVIQTDDGYDNPADPKTGKRPVPIPLQLVRQLQVWIDQIETAKPPTLLFRTRSDSRPALSNWNRALTRATKQVNHINISPCDCRHACATTWLGAGVRLGEVAMRLGHSVETLVAYYVGALEGYDELANERITDVFRRIEDGK